MSTEEQAREVLTQHRHKDEQRQETMLNRAETEVDNLTGADSQTQKHARELAAQERHHDEHLKETMLNRAKSEVNDSSDSD
ncbi:MAG: hypothetical protein LDL41_26020 [Coleofasciculus sp. S288]|nr:hypothetical protein [Coleofasciculus sp. S288]